MLLNGLGAGLQKGLLHLELMKEIRLEISLLFLREDHIKRLDSTYTTHPKGLALSGIDSIDIGQ